MKKNLYNLFLFCALVFLSQIKAQSTQTFSFTGTVQTFTVPPCVGTLTVDVRGGEGANAADRLPTNSTGGLGGRAQGVLTVTPGQVINIYVGSAGLTNGNGGYNGGGAGGSSSAGSSCQGGFAGGGGGASDIRIGGTALANRVIVAGGGGGSGRDYCNGSCQPCGCGGSGGAGGGLTGNNGSAAGNCNFGYPGSGTNFGGGGSQSVTANGGPGDNGGTGGSAGTLGNGGAGAGGSLDVAGGGGGGGYFGGGGGGSASSGSGVGGGGGGGGSSFIAGLTGASTTSSFQTGDGLVVLTYTSGMYVNISSTNSVLCTGASATLSVPGMTAYNWSNGSTGSSIVVSPTGNTTYSVSGMTSGGCPVLPSFITVTVSGGLPVLSVTSSTNNTCLGKTATLTATGALTYTWSNGVTNGVSFNPSVTTTYTVTGLNGCGTSSAVTTITVAPLPVSVIATPTQVCAGSAATLTSASAATNYTWAPVTANASTLIVSPIANTVYTITVSDGTCSGNATVAVNTVPVPTILVSPTLATVCSGVPVNLTASGGTSYTWTPGNINGASVTFTPNAPTGYQVIGSNSLGCTAVANAAIITNASPTLNITANTNLVCAGDQVDITANGASTYTWDTGSNSTSISVNPMVTTVYTLTGTSNGCSSTETISISVFVPTLAISGSTSICSGKGATLTASAANSYVWSNGFTTAGILVNPSSTTIYSVTALTNSSGINCPSSASLQLVVRPNPTVTAVMTKTAICKLESTTINASGANTYSWSTGASTSSIIATSSLVTTVNYSVVGTSTNACTATASVQLKFNACTGINEMKGLASALQIFPNPSAGEFNVEFNSEIKLDLINELGQVIKVLHLNAANDYKVHVSGLSSGIYFLSNQSGEQKIERKIIVTK